MKKKIFSLLMVFVLLLAVVACGKKKPVDNTPDDGGEDEPTVVEVSTVLEYKPNDSVLTKGVVFALTSDGFYMADSKAGIYVQLSDANKSSLTSLKKGDEVEVSGKFATRNNQPFIKNASAKVLASDKTALSASAMKLAQVNVLTATEKANYGKLFTVVAAVSKDEANRIVLTDDTGFVYLADENYADYSQYVGKKISTSYVLVSYDNNNWTVLALKETASVQFVNVDDVKEKIYETVIVPAETYGTLELVTSYEPEPGVEFTWSVKEGNAIEITDNVPNVKIGLEADSNVVLTLTLTSGTTSATKDYSITVKAAKAVTLAGGKAESGYLVTSGLVVACGIADELSNYHYIIVIDQADESLTYYPISVSSEMRKSVKVGDKIQFVGKYFADETVEENVVARPRYDDVQAIKVLESGISVDYTTMNAITLETTADYEAAANNNHEKVLLYKVVNPFMVGSGSTTYNWNQFGPTLASAGSGITNSRQFSMLIKNLAENGLNTWEADFAVPTKAVGAKQYPGTVLYVFSIYQTGETKWSFILPNSSASIYDEKEAVKVAINEVLASEITATEAGTYELPAKVTIGEKEYALTWASSDDSKLNASTGAYPVLYDETTVELTATFTVGEKQEELKFSIKMLAKAVEAISVSQALEEAASAEGNTATIIKLEAYIANIGSSSENNAEFRYGLMLTDGKKVAYFKTTQYTVGETELKPYDKIEIRNAKITCNADEHIITDGEISYISSNNTIDYSQLVIDATITTEEELAAFLGAHGVTRGLVVKFAGESIYFVGTGSTSATGRYQLNYKKAASSAAARYTYNLTENKEKSLVFNLPGTRLIVPTDWWTDCGMPEKSGSKSYEVQGSLIAVGGYNGNTMHAWTVINADEFKLHKVSDETLVGRAIEAAVDPTINAYTAGTYELPASVKVGETDYALTWTSANDAIMNGFGVYAAVTSETKVKLTASFKVGETNCTYEVEFTLVSTEPAPLTVTEALNQENGAKVTVVGAVIAFSADGNSGSANKGFVMMDNATGKIIQVRNYAETVTYPEFKYDNSEANVAIGDSVKVKGTFTSVTGDALYIDLNKEAKVSFVEKVTLNYHEGEEGSAVVEIKTDAELDALMTSGDYFGKILKFVGTAENPIYTSGSGTSASTICNFKVGFHYDGQIKYNNITISTKSDVNAPNTDGTTTFSKALYGATRDDGKMAGSESHERVGTLYITVCYKTSTYYQSSIVNFAGCSLEAKPAA